MSNTSSQRNDSENLIELVLEDELESIDSPWFNKYQICSLSGLSAGGRKFDLVGNNGILFYATRSEMVVEGDGFCSLEIRRCLGEILNLLSHHGGFDNYLFSGKIINLLVQFNPLSAASLHTLPSRRHNGKI